MMETLMEKLSGQDGDADVQYGIWNPKEGLTPGALMR
jgi:hypothetical protein